MDYLLRHGAVREDITIIRVPGAFELPIVASKAAKAGKSDAIICMSTVIHETSMGLPCAEQGTAGTGRCGRGHGRRERCGR